MKAHLLLPLSQCSLASGLNSRKRRRYPYSFTGTLLLQLQSDAISANSYYSNRGGHTNDTWN